MIRTKEEMHHSTGDVPSCPAHPACTAGRCQERRTDGDLCQYKRLPPSTEHCKAPDRLLWEQRHLQARREQGRAPESQERVGPEPRAPVPAGTCTEGEGHTGLRKALVTGTKTRGCGARTGRAQEPQR